MCGRRLCGSAERLLGAGGGGALFGKRENGGWGWKGGGAGEGGGCEKAHRRSLGWRGMSWLDECEYEDELREWEAEQEAAAAAEERRISDAVAFAEEVAGEAAEAGAQAAERGVGGGECG